MHENRASRAWEVSTKILTSMKSKLLYLLQLKNNIYPIAALALWKQISPHPQTAFF